jgi:NAD(P)-dependent dehydrogenase (short-subunit alcohol dehydrogenase family)
MAFAFKNKVFIITGSAGGLGRGFAEAVLKVLSAYQATYCKLIN